jgi:hypothetical protein
MRPSGVERAEQEIMAKQPTYTPLATVITLHHTVQATAAQRAICLRGADQAKRFVECPA